MLPAFMIGDRVLWNGMPGLIIQLMPESHVRSATAEIVVLSSIGSSVSGNIPQAELQLAPDFAPQHERAWRELETRHPNLLDADRTRHG